MGILVTCQCGKVLDVPEKYAGRRGRCPDCQAWIEVPVPAAAAGDAPSAAAGRQHQSVCGICRWKIEETDPTQDCPSCKAVYHVDCWHENKGCAIYGCPEVPPTENWTATEMSVAYWGQEEKNCPACGAKILAVAVRCRHCGAEFSAARPESRLEYEQSQSLKFKLPALRRSVILLFVCCAIPPVAPLGLIVGFPWFYRRRAAIRKMPAFYFGLARLALGLGVVQTVVLVLMAAGYALVSG